MAAPASAQIGFVEESAYGVPAAVTRFLPVMDVSLERNHERLESEGVVAGLDVIGTEQWNGGPVEVVGSLGFELYADGLPLLFKAMFGSAGVSGSNPYTHTFTPTSSDVLPSLCAQVGWPGPSAVYPAEYRGLTVASWEIACSQGEIATLGLDVVATTATYGTRSVSDGATTNADATVTSVTGAFTDADIGKSITGTGIPAGAYIVSLNSSTSVEISANATATGTGVTVTIGRALATASYPANTTKPLKFNHASLTIGGTAQSITELTLAGDNALKVDRRFLGSPFISQPKREGRREYTGEFTQEFADTAAGDRFINGTEAALVATFAASATLSVVISGNVRFDGGTPSETDAKSLVETGIPFKFVRSSTTLASAITATLINATATAA